MKIVVADTGPLHYLVLTGDIALLPTLFEKILTNIRNTIHECWQSADSGAAFAAALPANDLKNRNAGLVFAASPTENKPCRTTLKPKNAAPR